MKQVHVATSAGLVHPGRLDIIRAAAQFGEVTESIHRALKFRFSNFTPNFCIMVLGVKLDGF